MKTHQQLVHALNMCFSFGFSNNVLVSMTIVNPDNGDEFYVCLCVCLYGCLFACFGVCLC